MQADIHHTVAAIRLKKAGYVVTTNLARDSFKAIVRGHVLVALRIKNACVPEHKIWQAEQAIASVRAAGRLYY
jgi:hypothetical protein